MTTSPLPDGEPAVAPDGRIFFVRGRLGAAALWARSTNGTEAHVTKDRAVERWPSVSMDGSRLAYVSISDGTRKLHVRTLDGARDSTVLTDAQATQVLDGRCAMPRSENLRLYKLYSWAADFGGGAGG